MNWDLFVQAANPWLHKILGEPQHLWNAVRQGQGVIVTASGNWTPPEVEHAVWLFGDETHTSWLIEASARMTDWMTHDAVSSVSPDAWPDCRLLEDRTGDDKPDGNFI